jgi:hypothetical protein
MDGGDATTLKKGGPGIIYFRRHRVVSWTGELEVSVSGIHTPLGLKCLSFLLEHTYHPRWNSNTIQQYKLQMEAFKCSVMLSRY